MIETIEHISEDGIKRAALGFLKTYYKFRPRSGETKVSADNFHPSGIVADGFLEFPDENNKIFTATFEATSADKINEVKFSTHTNDLGWDSFVFAAIGTLLLMTLVWKLNLLKVTAPLGIPESLALIFLSLGALGFSFYLSCKASSKYRYIYAIEQFKRYHADEQWIALGANVFSTAEDTHYEELRNQCIKNGIGLFLVRSDKHGEEHSDAQIDLKITPAREEIFHLKRKKLNFVHREGLDDAHTATDYSRFSNQHYAQIIMSFGSLILLSTLFYSQWTQNDNNTIFAPDARLKNLEQRGATAPETHDVFVPKFLEDENLGKANSPEPLAANREQRTAQSPQRTTNEDVGLYVFVPGADYVPYPCERVNIKGNKFIVQDGEFPTFAAAKKRIQDLAQFELIANCISLKCLKKATVGYAVYFEFIYKSEEDATARYNQIKTQFQQYKLSTTGLKTRMLIF